MLTLLQASWVSRTARDGRRHGYRPVDDQDGTATDHVNTALSENTMYGPGKVSIVDETARLEFVFETRSGSIWRMPTV